MGPLEYKKGKWESPQKGKEPVNNEKLEMKKNSFNPKYIIETKSFKARFFKAETR